jgi:hypothetical protein
MADFCKQCSETVFGKDFHDLAGLTTKADTEAGRFAVVICEGCGATQVDHTGRCVAPDCDRAHGAGGK